MGKPAPKNREDLIQRLEETWRDILNVEYVTKVCAGVWERLGRVVDAEGSYMKPKDIDVEED